MSKKLSNTFGVPAVVHETLPSIYSGEEDIKSDAEQARANIKRLIAMSQRALEEYMEVAIESENPRAYEVLSNLINSAADLNSKLIDVHGNEQKIAKNTPGAGDEEGKNVTNNNIIFSGTTSELNDMILKRITKT